MADLVEAKRQILGCLEDDRNGFMEEVQRRIEQHHWVQRILSPGYMDKLTEDEWNELLRSLWAMEAYGIIGEVIAHDRINAVRSRLKEFLASEADMETRIARAKEGMKLRFMGEATLTEILMWQKPAEYPVKNKRSVLGLCVATNDERLKFNDLSYMGRIYSSKTAETEIDPPLSYAEFRDRVTELVPIMQDAVGSDIGEHRYICVDCFFNYIYEKFRQYL